MSKNDKSNEEDLQNKEESLNGSDLKSDTDQELESSHQDDNKEEIGTLTYEELFDKKEELEGLLLRANADLDNALKRTLIEVEKAHKYGTERLLIDLLPIIDNLENALSNLSKNSTNSIIPPSNLKSILLVFFSVKSFKEILIPLFKNANSRILFCNI